MEKPACVFTVEKDRDYDDTSRAGSGTGFIAGPEDAAAFERYRQQRRQREREAAARLLNVPLPEDK